MPVTMMGIVYSTGKKHVRRHVYLIDPNIADQTTRDDSELNSSHWLGPGESMVLVPLTAHYAGHVALHTAVNTAVFNATGNNAVQHDDPAGNAVIINSNNVVEANIRADDSIDTLPGKLIVNHATAVPGHIYNPASNTFTIPSSMVFTSPKTLGLRSLFSMP